jgi:TFIIF-interacting CTD phosphatase-like protein
MLAQQFRIDHLRDPTVQELTDLMPEVVFNVRPFSEHFLNELSKYYELIIFTAAEQAVSLLIFNSRLSYVFCFYSTLTRSWTSWT